MAAGAVSSPPLNATHALEEKTKTQPLSCDAHKRRDLALESMMRWAVDAHFRRCSRSLQSKFHGAVSDGVQVVLDLTAARVAEHSARARSVCPLACRVLLSFVGGLAGDGGVKVLRFLQDRCAAELRAVLARATASTSGQAVVDGRVSATREMMAGVSLPLLEAYVGHLCLCRHVTDTTAATHLEWLARQALAVVRLLEAAETSCPTSTHARRGDVCEGTASSILRLLCHALALLLTRPQRNLNTGRFAPGLSENVGNLLEIVVDSDARPLAGVPQLLAEAAIDALQKAGYLAMTQMEALLDCPVPESPPQKSAPHSEGDSGPEGCTTKATARESEESFTNGFDFGRASLAFPLGWSLATAGVDSPRPVKKRTRRTGVERDEGSDSSDGDGDSANEHEFTRAAVSMWESVPDEVTRRVFLFLTPKRISRLACVNHGWSELIGAEGIWKPLFLARWRVRALGENDDLAAVTNELSLEVDKSAKRRKRRHRRCLVHWPLLKKVKKVSQPHFNRFSLYTCNVDISLWTQI